MEKQIIILNNSSSMLSKEYIHNLIVEINKFQINKAMKQLLLIASINLLSNVKTTKGLTYQLENFKNQGKVFPDKTKSKYINNTIREIKKLPISDFSANIDNLVKFLELNHIKIEITSI
jgi:hypothetical protein